MTLTSKQRLFHIFLGVVLMLTAAGHAPPPPAAPEAVAAVPAGFTDTLFVNNVGAPTAIAFTPDGRMLVTTQGGLLRVYDLAGSLLGTAVDFTTAWPSNRICSDFERGLLGVAVDPNFTNNSYLYLFYTFRKFGACPYNSASSPVNRVSRFVMAGNTVLTATETLLVDNMPSPNGNHNAGDVQIGNDGHLYISIGDGGCDYASGGCSGSNDAARDRHALTGKILRVTRDGGIPPDNPFLGPGTDRCNVTGITATNVICQETFAWGLRNPFRIAFDPNTPLTATRFYINDVGQGQREEIDLAVAGGDFGWNCREGTRVNNTSGPCNPTPPNMLAPNFEYTHGVQIPGTTSPTNCNSITGGAFVPDGVWPAEYTGAFMFADYVCGGIFRLNPNNTAADFGSSLGGVTHLRFGPYGGTQALYYATYGSGGDVRRVSYNFPGTNPPVALLSANPALGPEPLNVTLSAFGTYDPDSGQTALLTYDWNFGDGSPVLTNTTSITVSHLYTVPGTYTATVTARDPFGLTGTAAAVIQPGNTAPVPVINLPSPSDQFAVGQVITVSGSATDTEHAVSTLSLSWSVRLHHVDVRTPGGGHTHPWYSTSPVTSPTGAITNTFTAPPPEDGYATELSYVEIQFTATDPWGASATVTQTLQPRRVNLTFGTSPAGLQLQAGTVIVTTTQALVAWENWAFDVSAPVIQAGAGGYWAFSQWSDDAGAGAARTLVAPAAPMTYTAVYTPALTFWLPIIQR